MFRLKTAFRPDMKAIHCTVSLDGDESQPSSVYGIGAGGRLRMNLILCAAFSVVG